MSEPHNAQQPDSTPPPRPTPAVTLLDVLVAGSLGPLSQTQQMFGVTLTQLADCMKLDHFRGQLGNLSTLMNAQTQLFIDQQQLLAVAKLVEIISTATAPETLRRACKDLLNIRKFDSNPRPRNPPNPRPRPRNGSGPSSIPGHRKGQHYPEPPNADAIRAQWEKEGREYWERTDPNRPQNASGAGGGAGGGDGDWGDDDDLDLDLNRDRDSDSDSDLDPDLDPARVPDLDLYPNPNLNPNRDHEERSRWVERVERGEPGARAEALSQSARANFTTQDTKPHSQPQEPPSTNTSSPQVLKDGTDEKSSNQPSLNPHDRAPPPPAQGALSHRSGLRP